MIRVFTSKTQALGEKGESEAVSWLKQKGFSIVARNVPNRYGEIDIVAKRKGIVYFFEVKAGRKGSWFNPVENLTKDKLRKFLRSVEYYCLINRVDDYRAQGIVVLFDRNGGVGVEVIDLT